MSHTKRLCTQLSAWAPLLVLSAMTSCGVSNPAPVSTEQAGATGPDQTEAGAPGAVGTHDDGGTAGVLETGGVAGNETAAAEALPPGYTQATHGGYKRGAEVTPASSENPEEGGAIGTAGDAGASSVSCGSILTGIARDFRGINEPGGHPDFEAFAGVDPSLGIVLPDLGVDQKPVYAGDGPFIDGAVNGDNANGQQTTSKANFDQWYRTVPGVNIPYLVHLYSEPNGKLRTFQSNAFFPLDGAGWGNTPGQAHNFGFTTEVHVRFTYRSGGIFALTGDDDLWVFVNHHLAIDLGGLHSPATKTISLDTESAVLGIQVGKVYDLDLFHAERHTTQSNFQMDTNLEFSECGIVVPDGEL